jgi:hypothetical protein
MLRSTNVPSSKSKKKSMLKKGKKGSGVVYSTSGTRITVMMMKRIRPCLPLDQLPHVRPEEVEKGKRGPWSKVLLATPTTLYLAKVLKE